MDEYVLEQLNRGRKVFNFMRCNRFAFIIAGMLFLTSITVIIVRGFNWGLDFSGGTLIELTLEQPSNLNVLRKELVQAGFKNLLVQNLGNNKNILIRTSSTNMGKISELDKKILYVINKTIKQNASIKRGESVGPTVGGHLIRDAISALSLALITILIYIGVRFTWRMALAIVLTLIHDLTVNCGILSLLHIQIDLTILASLMSVIGYSLNDKIVVSDRIRENYRKIHNGTSSDIINVSLTQILNRTLITSFITLSIVTILLVYGGELLKGFSLTMLIGIIIGTISSIYISSALPLKLGMKRDHMLVEKVEKEGADHRFTLP